MRWIIAAFVAIIAAFIAWGTWSDRTGRERAYYLPLTLVSTRTETAYIPVTVTVMAGTTPMPITTMTQVTTHYVLTSQGEYVNGLSRPAPLTAGCARIEPRPGQGRFITAFTATPCPDAP